MWQKFMQPRDALKNGQQKVKHFDYQLLLDTNPRIVRDNYFYGGFIIIIIIFLQFKLI